MFETMFKDIHIFFIALIFLLFTVSIYPLLMMFKRKRILSLLFINWFCLSIVFLKYTNIYHAGIFFLVFTFCMWISWPEQNEWEKINFRRFIRSILLFIFFIQISWTLSSSIRDVSTTYSGAEQTANYIKNHNLEGKISAENNVKLVAIQPYFDSNVFSNAITCYYTWDKTRETFLPLLNKDYIIISGYNKKDNLPPFHLEAKFSGKIIYKSGYYEDESFYIYKITDKTRKYFNDLYL